MPATSRRNRRSPAFVDVFYAKTHFSQLFERVAKGEEVTITKHDQPVARLLAAGRPSQENIATIFKQMDELRQSLPKSKDKTSLKDLIHEARRL